MQPWKPAAVVFGAVSLMRSCKDSSQDLIKLICHHDKIAGRIVNGVGGSWAWGRQLWSGGILAWDCIICPISLVYTQPCTWGRHQLWNARDSYNHPLRIKFQAILMIRRTGLGYQTKRIKRCAIREGARTYRNDMMAARPLYHFRQIQCKSEICFVSSHYKSITSL